MAGEYVVTIKSEICMPDDITLLTCTLMSDEYNFTIFVKPCEINTYTATTKVIEIVYSIGDPTLTDGLYAFEE